MKCLKIFVYLFFQFFLASSVNALSEGAAHIAQRIAHLKEKTHRALTAAKDVAPLIKRVDEDLLALEAQKKILIEQKKKLQAHKDALQAALNQRKDLLTILQAERATIEHAWERQSAQLDAFMAQKSIQSGNEGVAQSTARDTLLARVFDVNLTATSQSLLVTWHNQAEDVRG